VVRADVARTRSQLLRADRAVRKRGSLFSRLVHKKEKSKELCKTEELSESRLKDSEVEPRTQQQTMVQVGNQTLATKRTAKRCTSKGGDVIHSVLSFKELGSPFQIRYRKPRGS
jgi:hypothetical protein